jgi:hypothetical protein
MDDLRLQICYSSTTVHIIINSMGTIDLFVQYGETGKWTPKSMPDSGIDLPAGPRGTAPTAAHPPNRYGPAPHTLPARETG